MNIFLDLDGVMADLEGHYLSTFGHTMKDAPSRNQMWRNIDEWENFWLEIPPMKGAVEFYHWLKGVAFHNDIGLYILTAAPDLEHKHMGIARHKKEWVREHLDNVMVLPSYGSVRKIAFLQDPGDVLIDDYHKNCAAWEAEGGKAIQHTGEDFVSTRSHLVEFLARRTTEKERMYG